ncbi:MAG: hypothetical protein AAF439_05100 [Pseudomonadota bacterium]
MLKPATTPERLGLYREALDGVLVTVQGPDPTQALTATAAEMRASPKSARSGLRKLDQTYLVRTPLAAGGAVLWLMPATTPLDASAIQRLSAEATALFPPAEGGAKSRLRDLVEALGKVPKGRSRKAMRRALEAVMSATGWTGAAALAIRGGRVRRVVGTQQFADAKQASLRVFAGQMLTEQRLIQTEQRGDLADRAPDIDLYLDIHDLPGFAIALPEGDGLGLYVEGDVAETEAESARAALALATGYGQRSAERSLRGPLALAAAAAIAAVLAWPIRFEIGATAVIEPANSRMVVLDYEARLTGLNARVGEDVAKDAELAVFESPTLIEQEKQAALDQMLETLAAQEALAGDDYANYQLAEQRKAIAAFQAEQSRRRLESLRLTAPEDGRVAFILTEKQMGTLMPAGSPVAEIQIGADVRARLRISGLDGPLITPGMTGEVVVRGLVNQSFPITVLEHPALVSDETGAQSLSVLASIKAPEDARLLKGLTGYARLHAGTERRIWVWSRPVIEFLRLRLWTYLGLHL